MEPKDILKLLTNVALITAFVLLAIFTACPWQVAILGAVAVVAPSALPAIAAAMREYKPSPPAAQHTFVPPPPPPQPDFGDVMSAIPDFSDVELDLTPGPPPPYPNPDTKKEGSS